MDKLKWDRDFALEQAAEDEGLLQELIDIFKTSFLSDFNFIEKGVESQDAELVCSAAHSIKGAAASLGIEAIRAIAFDIENDSRQGSVEIAEKKINELNELLQLLQQL